MAEKRAELKIEYVKIGDLKPFVGNPRKIEPDINYPHGINNYNMVLKEIYS